MGPTKSKKEPKRESTLISQIAEIKNEVDEMKNELKQTRKDISTLNDNMKIIHQELINIDENNKERMARYQDGMLAALTMATMLLKNDITKEYKPLIEDIRPPKDSKGVAKKSVDEVKKSFESRSKK